MRNPGRSPSVAVVLCLFASACGTSDDTRGSIPDASVAAPTAQSPGPLGDEVAIDEISVSQAVKVTLVTAGAAVATPNAPIIANRPAFVRVYVKAKGKAPPVVSGELRVKRAGREDLVLSDLGKRTTREPDEESLESTLNFTISAEDMTADASFSVKAGLTPSSEDVVRFPADGSAMSLGAKTSSQTLRVKVVPVSYEATPGVVITPDVADLSVYKETLYKLYPVASIELSVREPIPWTSTIEAGGKGWDGLLSSIVATRRADGVDRDVYYVGVFTPKPTMGEFCGGGACVLGLAPLAEERDVGLRAAIVLGYTGRASAGTMAHEIAHAMGRGHAPCGAPAGVDEDFPYKGGSIGVWGYDIVKKKLIDPGKYYRDFMTYCDPDWISDYTYRNLFERMEIVTKQQLAAPPAPGVGGVGGLPGGSRSSRGLELVRSFRVGADRAVAEGPEIEVLPDDGLGSHVTVSYEGALGNVFATTKGRVRPLSEFGGSIVLAPPPPAGATRARLAGLGVANLVPRPGITR